jgi:hypothetical protein
MTNFEISSQDAENIYNIGSVGVMHTYVYNTDAQEVIQNFETWWQQKHRRYLRILVLASTKEQVQASDFAEIADCYGNLPEEWKPYQNEPNIKALLFEEYQTASKIPLIVGFVSMVDFQNPAQKRTFIAQNFPKTILITDGVAFCQPQNSVLANIYNHNQTNGNLIFALCHSSQARKEVGKHFEGILEDVAYRFHEDFESEATRYELEVPTKALLFRRLTNMAYRYDLLQQETTISSKEENKNGDLMFSASIGK